MTSVVLYFIVFFMVSVMVSQDPSKRKGALVSVIFGLFLLILFAAGRYHVGTDTTLYLKICERLKNQSWYFLISEGVREILFGIVAKIAYSVGGRVLVLGVFASLVVIPVYETMRHQYSSICLGVSFFVFLFSYYVMSFNILRQFIAIAILFWGMRFIFENRLCSYVIVVVVAMGFHLSAIVAILMWFLWDHKKNCALKGIPLTMLLGTIAMAVVGYRVVIGVFVKIIPAFSYYSGFLFSNSRGNNRDWVLSILECVVLLIFRKRMIQEDERIDFMYSLLIISVLIGFTGFYHPQIKRLAYYFAFPARLVLYGFLPYAFYERSKELSKIIVGGYVVVVFVTTAYFLRQADLIPYQFDLFSAW